MQQCLIREESLKGDPTDDQGNFGTFREFRKEAGSFGPYQQRLLLLMGCYWVTASFFLILPFYFFKRPLYCLNTDPSTQDCLECLHDCVESLCNAHPDDIARYILSENTLTDRFGLFCGQEPLRIFYKICPESLSWIGLLIYGAVADGKGRKVAFKISWRFYTFGLVLYTATETQFLISFGYLIACVNCFPSLVIQFVLLFEQIGRKGFMQVQLGVIRPLIQTEGLLLVALVSAGGAVGGGTAGGTTGEVGTEGVSEHPVHYSGADPFLHHQLPGGVGDLLLQGQQAAGLQHRKQHREGQSPATHHHRPLPQQLAQVRPLPYLSLGRIGPKLRMSFLFMLAFFFNNRLAQISLDDFTNEYLRGMLMNCTSAVATITVIILITRYQVNRFTYFAVGMLVGSLLDVVVTATGMDSFLIDSAISIAIRYLSDLSYSLFLIYTIETFPTVCRTQCLAFALTGSSVGVVLAYTLSQYRWAELVLGLLLNMLLVVRSKDIQLDYENKLRDTLKDQYYDQNDRFKRV